jgi:hypothetical protein
MLVTMRRVSGAIWVLAFCSWMTIPRAQALAQVLQVLHDRVSAMRLDCVSKAGFGDYPLPLSYAPTI